MVFQQDGVQVTGTLYSARLDTGIDPNTPPKCVLEGTLEGNRLDVSCSAVPNISTVEIKGAFNAATFGGNYMETFASGRDTAYILLARVQE